MTAGAGARLDVAMAYEDSVRALYQVPLAEFVAERKRLSDELRAAGDKKGAAKLKQQPRPSVSAWVTNQLYWHARDVFDAMLATAAKIRAGDHAATAPHRDAIAQLRQRATAMLTDAGHAATSATLHKVGTNLAAISALNGFFPDQPGEMTADRDPPGFGAKPP
jgi:hypothetical protein